MREIAGAVPPLTAKPTERLVRGEAMRGKPQPIERAALDARFRALMGSGV
jgi:hypothetical protein